MAIFRNRRCDEGLEYYVSECVFLGSGVIAKLDGSCIVPVTQSVASFHCWAWGKRTISERRRRWLQRAEEPVATRNVSWRQVLMSFWLWKSYSVVVWNYSGQSSNRKDSPDAGNYHKVLRPKVWAHVMKLQVRKWGNASHATNSVSNWAPCIHWFIPWASAGPYKCRWSRLFCDNDNRLNIILVLCLFRSPCILPCASVPSWLNLPQQLESFVVMKCRFAHLVAA